MAMKRIFLLCCSTLVAIVGFAQEVNVDSLNSINKIKRDTSYIYAESTMRDAVEAESYARTILEMKVGEWLRNKYPNESIDTCLLKVNDHSRTLLTFRGKYKRAFVFLKKDMIVPQIEPVACDTLVDSVAVEAVEPVAPAVTVELTPDEKDMVAVADFPAIEPYVKNLKSDGRLRAYGKYATLPEDTNCHLFVYDRDGQIAAVLRQTEDGKYYNLRTLQEDNVKNYTNCGAIWLQLK